MSYPPTADRQDGFEEHELLAADDGRDRRPSDTERQAEEAEREDLMRRYEDFSTVDWIQDSLLERTVQSKGPTNPFIARLDRIDGAFGYVWRLIRRALEEGESWVVITLVGVIIGISAGMISIITAWLSDMKLGYCSTGWWLTQKYCCLEITEEFESCAEWRTWGGIWPLGWIAYIIWAAAFAFSAAFLVKNFAPYAAGSGISEIKCILGGFIIKGFLSAETFFIKGLTLPLAIASGLSVGKEGPSVHVACSIGNVIARMFSRYDRSHLKMREIVTASSAAGVAVAFGSPIGGVLFSIEEMNQTFSNRTMWRSFVCALVATFTLASVDPFRTGKIVLFQVSYDRDWHYFEIPAYILIGIFGGLYGAFVIKFNLQVAAFRRKHLANHGISEAVTLAIITAFVGYMNRFLRSDMTESLSLLFRECEGGGDHEGLCQTSAQWRMVNSLLIATVVRTALVIVSYGCKVPAGIFVPSMAVGATFGRMIGILVKAMHTSYPQAPWFAACAPDAPCITPGTYAFLGAAAALGGITRITVTVVVIMFELTGALTYILPTMAMTKAVSDQFGGGGIADQMIRLNGYPFLEKEDKEDTTDQTFIEPIANVMKKDIVTMSATGVPLQQIAEMVQSTNYQGFPVVKSDADRTIIGFVRKNELRYALDKARRTRNLATNAICTFQHTPPLPLSPDKASDGEHIPRPESVVPGRTGSVFRTPSVSAGGFPRRESGVEAEEVDFGEYVDEIPLTVSPKMPLEIVLQLFRRMGPRVILVSDQGKLVGLVTVKDVLRHEVVEHHRHTRLTSANASVSPLTTRNPYSHARDDSTSTNGGGGWDLGLNMANRYSEEVGGSGSGSGNGLEIALEEGFAWLRIQGSRMYNIIYENFRNARNGDDRRGYRENNTNVDFELNED
uniref:Chloride channel protein n=1 Tax=Kwoniella dejecticola CBS 10117 TaxID=1296121 RepID=A0A1A6AFG0_9TREE|nr:chloride channel, other eukaryote [Kwoniella dejecticola CBS 10117]OBR88763.1 chloride channel, other eukaryote [Kwoniella dejecticola CBS 10117]